MSWLEKVFRTERDKAIYLLTVVVIHNLIYPMSVHQGVPSVIFYLIFSTMFVLAVFMMTEHTLVRWGIALSGGIVFVAGVANAWSAAANRPILLTLYLSVIVYHLIMIVVLSRYIFVSKRVLTEVVLAATSLYLIIGSIFTAIFGVIEWFAPNSFTSASGMAVDWQQFLYFSYVNLTSLGYGDILPVGYYAQAFATFEAIIGVLYTVILLSRLVGLHESK